MIRTQPSEALAHALQFGDGDEFDRNWGNRMTIKSGRFVLVCGVAFSTVMCSGNASPTGPTTTTTSQSAPVATAQPAPTPTPAPPPPTQAAPGRVELHVVPNPVPFSGQPITNAPSCASSRNTWFYDQVLLEVGGTAVTFRNRVDAFDGAAVNDLSNLNMVIPAYTSITVQSRWCSNTAVQHTAQTTFSGTDANGNAVKVTSAMVTLMKP